MTDFLDRQERLPLFDDVEPTINDVLHAARREQLDDTSWVELVPGFLSGGEMLLQRMAASIPWERRQRWMYHRMVDEPRLTADYPDIADAPEGMLRQIAERLSAHYAVAYDGLWLNLYRDHRDGTGWHGDRPCRRPECIVPVLSLGSTRRFLLKSRIGGPSTIITPADGDLVVMGGRCQSDWVHCVPKQTKPSGRRISVNFQSSWQMAGDD